MPLPGMKTNQVPNQPTETSASMNIPPPPVATNATAEEATAKSIPAAPAAPAVAAAPQQAAPASAPAPQQAAPAPQQAAPAPQQAAPAPQQAAPAPTPAPQQAAPTSAPVPQSPAAPMQPPVPTQNQVDQQIVARTTSYSAVPESSNLATMAEEEGFAGLEFDTYGVFPIIKLDDGEFQTSEGDSLGGEFYCTMLRSRPKFLYRTNLPRDDNRNEVAYSYDNVTAANGTPLDVIFADWRSKGFEPDPKVTRYVEVTAKMEPDGRLVLLSIPQASIANLSSYWAQLRFRNKSVTEVVTKVFKGKKIERVKNPFTPWAFCEAPDGAVV